MTASQRRRRLLALGVIGGGGVVVPVAPEITSSAPANPVYGVAYEHAYTATGTTPITWSVTDGDLPDGLTLDADTGVLSGTPTAAGTFSWTVQAENAGGTDTQSGSATIDLHNYLLYLAPVLYMDGTLNGSNIANLGTAGSSLDGTPTDVTIDANGMNFNGTTSKIVIADNAAIQALATYSIVAIVNADGGGENNVGTVLNLGATSAGAFRIAGSGAWLMGYDTNTTDAISQTNASFFATGTLTAMFGTYDNAGDRTCRIYKGLSGTVTQASYAAQTAGTGTRVNPSGITIGNFSDVRTWDGIIQRIAVFNRILTAGEMDRITDLFPNA